MKPQRDRPHLLLAIGLTLTAIMIGCAQPPPRIQMGPDAEVTHDGLHLVEGTRAMQRVWAKPGIDLSEYTKILIAGAGIHYRRPPEARRGEFALSESRMEMVREGLRDAIVAELERNGDWQVVDTGGPDVLLMRGAIIDLVVLAEPPATGRNRSYSTSSIGEATLVIELFDSGSREILARIADRRAIVRDSSSWRNDAITNRAAARRVFRDWARRLRRLLGYARTGTLPTTEELDAAEAAEADMNDETDASAEPES